MTSMEATLHWRQVHLLGYVELLPEPFPSSFHSIHHIRPWFSHFIARRSQSPLAINGPVVQKKSFNVTLSSSLREEAVVTLPPRQDEPSVKSAIENAFISSVMQPLVASLVEPLPLKSHPRRRKQFPANGGSHTLSSSFLPSSNQNPGYTSDPSDGVMVCLKCLDVRGVLLNRVVKHVSTVGEEDLIDLLKTLSSYAYQRSEIKSMISKYPSLVKVKGFQVNKCFRYYIGLGFTRSVVASLFLARPALLACDLERTSQVINYLLSIGLRKEDLIAILARRPHILEPDVATLKSIVSALMKAKLEKEDIAKLIKRAPAAFTAAQGDIEKSLSFWSYVGVEGKFLCRAIIRRPNLLSYNTASMLSTYRYLQWWFKPKDLTKLVSRFAELLAHNPETKLEPLIEYFGQLGLSEEEVAKVILRRPQLMSCTRQRLEKVAEFLVSLGVKDNIVGKVLVSAPQVFTLNAEDKLRRGVEFFRSMGLDSKRDIEFLFARNAQAFCCSIEKNLLPTFEFFLSIGLEKRELAKMIVSFPSMLGQNVELSLAPKYMYLRDVMRRSNKEILEFPQYFGYSLEKRIRPRHELLSERGLYRSLPSMLACTNTDFYKRYVEPFPPLPQPTASLCVQNEAAKLLTLPKQLKVGVTKCIARRFKIKAADPSEPLSSANQETVPLDSSSSNISGVEEEIEPVTVSGVEERVEEKIEPVQQLLEWEFLNQIPRFHERKKHQYPAYFRKYYKELSPCGKWIHAYKLES